MRGFGLFVFGLVGLVGCASAPPPQSCPAQFELSVNPGTATADHSSTAPGNQQKFTAYSSPTVANASGQCAEPAVEAAVNATWTSSDPLDVSVSSAPGATNGVAICSGMTSSPVTLTATYVIAGVTKTGTAELSCK